MCKTAAHIQHRKSRRQLDCFKMSLTLNHVRQDIWRDKLYVIWAIAIPVALFGYFVPYVHLVEHVKTILPHNTHAELLVTT